MTVERLYVIGAGASCLYGLPTLKTLTWELCNFLPSSDRSVLLAAIYECMGIDMCGPGDSVDFEGFLDRLDPRALEYLPTDKAKEPRVQAAKIALSALREFIKDKCSKVSAQQGPFDRLVRSLGEHDAIATFNWDVLLELAFRRNAKPFSYWPTQGASTLLKPHGSINWFALLDRELLSIDMRGNWDVFGGDLNYYLLFLKDPLGSKDLGASSVFVNLALASVPAIVPPIASKILSVGGEPRDGFIASGHERAMRLIWQTFQQQVTEATQLIVIGYSLPGTDASSVSTLRQFAPDAASQRRKEVLVVDKNPNVVSRYQRLVHPNAELTSDDFTTFDPPTSP